ncbi:DUF418 domain-containing protein [Alteraurantiacibacter buctensis]|uniref:DUF418 domain-containing protein n=1 Tax=Alteraurantiacibacter buctensis TaxID=1503981 RepID=A0A844YQW9_9SPHN|nr:DUF418 domain-containing protein [Alteraurantiacibacter buctensis]MXO70735.1 DUF418 domain-containing protein [Alteraurantiacibacter buctensis]
MDKRVAMVDALRGWALMGLFLVHCVERFELFWFVPVYDRWYTLTFGLWGGKAFAVFALLFGFSFATIMANERARGGDFTWRFVRRLVLLFVLFGLIHVVFYRGEVLTVLAVMGLLLIPFDRVKSDRVLLAVALLAFAQLPLWWRWWAAGQGADWAVAPPLYASWGSLPTLAGGSFWQVAADNLWPGNVGKWSYYVETGRVTEIVGLFLLGMVLQRRHLLAEADQHRKLWLGVAVVSGALWALAALWLPGQLPAASEAQRQTTDWLLAHAANLPATAFHVSAFVSLWHMGLRPLLAWLAAPGRMTLTLYCGQSFLFAPLFYGYGLGLWDDMSNGAALAWGVLAWGAQALLAAWWFTRHRYGPLEWLWRAGTLGTASVPMRLVPDPTR